MIRANGYKLADEAAKRALEQNIKEENLIAEKAGNARLARNIVDKTIERQGSRCYQNKLSGNDLDILLPEDFNFTKENEKTIEEALEELDRFVGMEAVKTQVNELIAVAQHSKAMEERGHKAKKPSLHSVFSGNPGTGKTTVARVLGDIYKAMGMLSKGHVVEVSRQHLVASYVGQTVEKTQNVIEQALGGILFIDEAYTLSGRGENDFGQEAIDTILKAMEDYRDNLMVIVAGYPDDMKEFLESNVGLTSRFGNRIQFEDYNSEELMQIFQLLCKDEGYVLSPEAKEYLEGKFETMYLTRGRNFGNGRDVRNLFERAKTKMAVRIKEMTMKSEEDCITITVDDVKEADQVA
jgi:SpoVK/Ycf46/Vps4 family AAA+-type ATPase